MTFIPEKPAPRGLDIPYFEDQKESKIPGRGTEKTIDALQMEITDLMLRLGAGAVRFTMGRFEGPPPRFVFQIAFSMNGLPGRIDVAALPIRSLTDARKDRALAQALYLLRNWLESEVFSAVYRPGAIALLPFLVGEDGRTITESFVAHEKLPSVSPYWLPPLLVAGS